jgi:hypothetical protein
MMVIDFVECKEMRGRLTDLEQLAGLLVQINLHLAQRSMTRELHLLCTSHEKEWKNGSSALLGVMR